MCKEHSKGRAEFWTAVASALSAVAAFGSVYFAWKTIRDTKAQVQNTAMSACMQEYFSIRSEVAKEWDEVQKSPTPEKVKATEDHYGERMYGLHFEEYHLFRQGAIPVHVYTVWLQSLQKEYMKRATQAVDPPPSAGASGASSKKTDTPVQFPPLNIIKYTTNNPEEDFHEFITNVLTNKSDKIEDLVKLEKKKGGYD